MQTLQRSASGREGIAVTACLMPGLHADLTAPEDTNSSSAAVAGHDSLQSRTRPYFYPCPDPYPHPYFSPYGRGSGIGFRLGNDAHKACTCADSCT